MIAEIYENSRVRLLILFFEENKSKLSLKLRTTEKNSSIIEIKKMPTEKFFLLFKWLEEKGYENHQATYHIIPLNVSINLYPILTEEGDFYYSITFYFPLGYSKINLLSKDFWEIIDYVKGFSQKAIDPVDFKFIF